MEVRRMGYLIWRQVRIERKLKDEQRKLSIRLAEKLGPDRLRRLARSYSDETAANRRIIQMADQKLALTQ